MFVMRPISILAARPPLAPGFGRMLVAMHARLSMWWPADQAATPTRA
jgi:hypothetical protein